MNARLSGFEWDDGNLGHCRKHDVSRSGIEEVFTRSVVILPDPNHSQTERRFKAIGGTTGGRAVFIVFTIRERSGRQYIRPVSVRCMHQEKIANYEEENPDP